MPIFNDNDDNALSALCNMLASKPLPSPGASWQTFWCSRFDNDHDKAIASLLSALTFEHPYKLDESLSVITNLRLAYNVYHIVACAANVLPPTKETLTNGLATLNSNPDTLAVPDTTSPEPPPALVATLATLGLDLLATDTNAVIDRFGQPGHSFLLCLHVPRSIFSKAHFVFGVVVPQAWLLFPCMRREKTLCQFPGELTPETFMENIAEAYDIPHLISDSVYAFAFDPNRPVSAQPPTDANQVD